ncbi:MAG: hypothetical protein U0133_11130 [Gemmatimonadales bacterium]
MGHGMRRGMMGLVLAVAGAVGCGYDNNGGYGSGPNTPPPAQVVTASGDLTAALAQFRGLLGDSANRTVGEQAGGRREINWDGVSGAILNSDSFPADQFNRVVPRGQVFSTPGSGLRVSDNAFFDLDPSDSTQFSAFSPKKMFIAVGSPVIDVTFRVAGSDTLASVTGFGVVFADVDRAGSTTLEFFGTGGESLRKITVPVRSDTAGHSFAGAVFESPLVARVRITAGEAAVAPGAKDLSAGGTRDLVATDDFIAGEPHRIGSTPAN